MTTINQLKQTYDYLLTQVESFSTMPSMEAIVERARQEAFEIAETIAKMEAKPKKSIRAQVCELAADNMSMLGWSRSKAMKEAWKAIKSR